MDEIRGTPLELQECAFRFYEVCTRTDCNGSGSHTDNGNTDSFDCYASMEEVWTLKSHVPGYLIIRAREAQKQQKLRALEQKA